MLSASLSISFIQRLWSLFRLKAMKVSMIDSLLSLLQSPLKLLHFEVLWNARFEWGFAIFCFCIPIATVFPPGALSVVLKEQRQLETNKQVPTFIPTSKLTDNLAFHNGSGIQLVYVFKYCFFKVTTSLTDMELALHAKMLSVWHIDQ